MHCSWSGRKIRKYKYCLLLKCWQTYVCRSVLVAFLYHHSMSTNLTAHFTSPKYNLCFLLVYAIKNIERWGTEDCFTVLTSVSQFSLSYLNAQARAVAQIQQGKWWCLELSKPWNLMAVLKIVMLVLFICTIHSHGIIEPLRLEKTSKIIKSNCQPNTTMPAKPCPKVPHLHAFWTPPGMGTPLLPWVACSNACTLFH